MERPPCSEIVPRVMPHYDFGAKVVCALLLGWLVVSSPHVSAQSPAAQNATAVADPDLAHDLQTLSGLWGGRYRVTPGDVIQLTFPYVPEFDQTVAVQPDGYVSLRGADELHAAGRTVPELRAAVVDAYATTLRDAVVTVVLKEFEKPSFIASGEVEHPGRYELR